jgi:hypothetical protein
MEIYDIYYFDGIVFFDKISQKFCQVRFLSAFARFLIKISIKILHTCLGTTDVYIQKNPVASGATGNYWNCLISTHKDKDSRLCRALSFSF